MFYDAKQKSAQDRRIKQENNTFLQNSKHFNLSET